MGTATPGMSWKWQKKRAMSRAVLKLTGFYELGVFGEDESEDFKKEVSHEYIYRQQKSILD